MFWHPESQALVTQAVEADWTIAPQVGVDRLPRGAHPDQELGDGTRGQVLNDETWDQVLSDQTRVMLNNLNQMPQTRGEEAKPMNLQQNDDSPNPKSPSCVMRLSGDRLGRPI